MNAVEIEEALSELAAQPFIAGEFPFAFLTAFGNKETTVKRLRAGSGNASDVAGGVLQRNNIHMCVCDDGSVGEALMALRTSPKTAVNRIKFILATDGVMFEAEDTATGETIACDYPKFSDHFGFFLPLAGISTVKQIKNNPIDIKATGRLNKLYIELLKDNPGWATAERRHDLNQFMARLIFCFFAEDTGIFEPRQFSKIVEQMSDGQSSNTHEVIAELFRAMNTPIARRAAEKFRTWADGFPYVNGGLYAGGVDCPRFSRIARTYLLRAAELDWREINPDIFGSMIQAVADDAERGELGMHYTSVPNILKVLNPLFLDDLREKLEAAGDNIRKLKNLRRRIANIRVFDPACGSGNFLVIAYRHMRDVEAEIVRRLDDKPKSWIKLENFYGIEIKSFAAEIARLALLIAEFQCDVRLISQREAKLNVLPLHKTGQIHIANALKLNWLEICQPATKTIVEEWDLGGPTGRLALDDNGLGDVAEAETYICGNPPYLGCSWQSAEQKADMGVIFKGRTDTWGALDYVTGWFMKAADYSLVTPAASAFVSTNSLCQGQHVPYFWPLIYETGTDIFFAHTSFKWTNLASNNAGVTVVVVGIRPSDTGSKKLYYLNEDGISTVRRVPNISAYLVPGSQAIVHPSDNVLSGQSPMNNGNKAVDGGNLTLGREDVLALNLTPDQQSKLIRLFVGSSEAIRGDVRYCIWIDDNSAKWASKIPTIKSRLDAVVVMRQSSSKKLTRDTADRPYAFQQVRQTGEEISIVVPRVSSENRTHLPAILFASGTIISDQAFALYDAPLWNMSLIASKIHLVWIATVCGKMKSDFRYSNTLGWNTFPVPTLTEKNKADLTRCAEDILLARETHFPATIADLYDPENMPDNLRQAHERNDEVLERIYIGRRFRNDTERLEKLFELYTKMTANTPKKKGAA